MISDRINEKMRMRLAAIPCDSPMCLCVASHLDLQTAIVAFTGSRHGPSVLRELTARSAAGDGAKMKARGRFMRPKGKGISLESDGKPTPGTNALSGYTPGEALLRSSPSTDRPNRFHKERTTVL